MSVENKILAKKLAKAQQKQQQQQQQIDRVCTSHSHDVSIKESQNDVLMKKPYLKKRSGLFRFFGIGNYNGLQFPNRDKLYKCTPHNSHSTSHHHDPQQNHENSMPSRQSHPRANTNTNCNSFTMKNSRGGLTNNGTMSNMGINSPLSHGHRSTTYNPNISINEIKQVSKGQQLKRESPGEVEIFEIDDGLEKYNDMTPANSSRYNLKIDSFEQGDTNRLLNYHSNMDLSPTLLKENENPRPFQPTQTGQEHSNNPRNFIGNSTSNAGTSREPEDFLNLNLHLPNMSRCCFGVDEPEDGNLNYATCLSPSGNESDDGENISESSSQENFTLANPPEHHKFTMATQLSELHSELLGIKNKVAYLETIKNEDGRKTSIVKDNNKKTHHSKQDDNGSIIPGIGVIRKKPEELNNKSNLITSLLTNTTMSYQNAVEGIKNELERINTELNDMQNSFLQKMEGLEEEIQVKSQYWCDNQLKSLEHSGHSSKIFSDFEQLKNQVKAHQHHVQKNIDNFTHSIQNLAENVDKEFENVKTEWRDSQEATKNLQNRVKILEDQHHQLLEKIQHYNPITNCHSNNSINKERQDDKELKELRKQSEPKKDSDNIKSSLDKNPTNQHPVQVCNQGSQVSPTSKFNEQTMLQGDTQNNQSLIEPKLDSAGIISARKTLLNGDIETVYTNGTREIMKADKSEIRHMYRNGDVRTVLTEDGTVTYFYAASSTWQTTYPTGVELFKFPNGVCERRLPNGFIEQTDIEGRVTFFQAAPPKASGILHHPPVAAILKNDPDMTPLPKPKNIILQPPPKQPINVGVGGVGPGPIKLSLGERIIVFDNGEDEIHGSDYRKRIFSDGTVKTVYKDFSQETRYPNGRIRIKDRDGNLVTDVTPGVPEKHHHMNNNNSNKLVRDFGANTSNQC